MHVHTHKHKKMQITMYQNSHIYTNVSEFKCLETTPKMRNVFYDKIG